MNTLIVIPARFASKRFPGKPLQMIAGQSLLARVCQVARTVTQAQADCDFVVATDDSRIEQHCRQIDAPVVMTSPQLASGTDRALAAVNTLKVRPQWVLNLQGDAPMTPPNYLLAVINRLKKSPDIGVATPVLRLSWPALDQLRAHKQQTPFSGTTAIIDQQRQQALWFSKQILPSIRDEQHYRQQHQQSPVYQHIGLYGYQLATLERYVQLPRGHYEQLEGLEQLRLLEHGIAIGTVAVGSQDELIHAGIDTAEDAALLEQWLSRNPAQSIV